MSRATSNSEAVNKNNSAAFHSNSNNNAQNSNNQKNNSKPACKKKQAGKSNGSNLSNKNVNKSKTALKTTQINKAQSKTISNEKSDNASKTNAAQNQKTIDQKRHREVLEALEKAEYPTYNEVIREAKIQYIDNLSKGTVCVSNYFGRQSKLSPASLQELFFCRDIEYFSSAVKPNRGFINNVALKLFASKNPNINVNEVTYVYKKNKNKVKRKEYRVSKEIINRIFKGCKKNNLTSPIVSDLDFVDWILYVAQNPKYTFAKKYEEVCRIVKEYESRKYHPPKEPRRFILDIGPTNSGKTHSGMEALKAASSGVYLGPLRLLAMEVAEELNEAGVPCSLLTGEESHIVEDAEHIASTVEMLDRRKRYEVAVIDEVQMIADSERGHSWGAAIISINAEVIHLCMAPEVAPLIQEMLDNLDEEYELQYHDRLVPLKVGSAIHWPNDIQEGDAVIVFSRKSVHNYAAQLEHYGIKTSIVYGALPYDVRKEEVRKFSSGETKVVVATDAIGMGLNLPVKRVVFLEVEKFDGKTNRPLLQNEFKQIGGRAGRYGKYEEGIVTTTKSKCIGKIEAAIEAVIEPIENIHIDIPREIVDACDQPLSYIMQAWSMRPATLPYVKRNLTQQIDLAVLVEDLPNDFVAEAIEIPFAHTSQSTELDMKWLKAVREAYEGTCPVVDLYNVSKNSNLRYLEDAAKVADLAYGVAKRWGRQEDLNNIEKERKKISKFMIEALKKEKVGKTCSYCGKPMDPRSTYGMHQECFEEWKFERYGYYRWDYNDYYYDEDEEDWDEDEYDEDEYDEQNRKSA